MRKGRLENWHEIDFAGHTHMFGNVYECDAFEEGEEMITSGVVKYHNYFGSTVLETESGSLYTLGKAAEQPRTLREIFAAYADTQSSEKNARYN